MGVTVTFLALLELLKEYLIELVQAEPYAPMHVRAASNVKAVPDSEFDVSSAGGGAANLSGGDVYRDSQDAEPDEIA